MGQIFRILYVMALTGMFIATPVVALDQSRVERPSLVVRWVELSKEAENSQLRVRKGLACLPAGRTRVDFGAVEVLALREMLASLLDKEFQTNHAIRSKRFQNLNSNVTARFQVGGSVTQIGGTICRPHFPGYISAKGKINITMRWLLFDSRKESVVLEGDWESSAELDHSRRDATWYLFERAVEASFLQWLGSVEVQQILGLPYSTGTLSESSN